MLSVAKRDGLVNRQARRADASRRRHAAAMRYFCLRRAEARRWARRARRGWRIYDAHEVWLDGVRLAEQVGPVSFGDGLEAMAGFCGVMRRQPSERVGTVGESVVAHRVEAVW
jgi:hypothetical protein